MKKVTKTFILVLKTKNKALKKKILSFNIRLKPLKASIKNKNNSKQKKKQIMIITYHDIIQQKHKHKHTTAMSHLYSFHLEAMANL